MASSIDEQILRTAKEIVVKFIEVGRVSPTTFDESFKNIFNTISGCVRGLQHTPSMKDDTGQSS